MPAAHTCAYCEGIEICLPSQSELYRAHRFMGNQGAHLGTTVDGSRVLEGSKLSCKLFAWALDGFQTRCTNEHVEDWRLTIGVPFTCFDEDSPDFTHVLFTWGRWNAEGRVESYEVLDMLTVLAEEGELSPWSVPPDLLHPSC
jgi:hypothetical protein